MNRRTAALLLVVILTFGTAGAFLAATAPVAAQETTPTTPTNGSVGPNTTVEDADFSIEELRRGGKGYSVDAADSTFNPPGGRLIEDGAAPAYLIHYPVGPAADEFAYLETGERVKSRELTLLTSRWGKDVETLEYTLVLVYWQPATRQVTDGETTTTEPYAANQTLQRTELTIEDQNDPNDVRLQPLFGETWQVTAWLVDEDGERIDGARWRFVYQPVPTSQGLPFENRWDEFLPWAIVNFLLTAGLGSVLMIAGGTLATRKAGPAPALKIGGIVGFLAVLLYVSAFANTLTLITAAPYLLAIPVVVAALVTTLHMSANSFYIRAEKPHTVHVTDPLSDDVPSIETEFAGHYAATRYPNGDRGIIEPRKISSWLARFFADTGRIASSEWAKLVESEGPSPEAEKIYVDQDSEELIDFTPAGWRVRLLVTDYLSALVGSVRQNKDAVTDGGAPQDYETAGADEQLGYWPSWPSVFVAGMLGAGAFVVMLFTAPTVTEAIRPAAWAAFLALAFLRVEATPGRATVAPAPAHSTAAKAARIVEENEREKWSTFEKLAEGISERDYEGLSEALYVVDSLRQENRDRLDSLLGRVEEGDDD